VTQTLTLNTTDTAAAVRQYHRIAASLAGAPHSPVLQRLLRQMGRDVAGLRAAAAAALEAPNVSPEEAQVQQYPLPIECSLVRALQSRDFERSHNGS
jgi:hypothetical protein